MLKLTFCQSCVFLLPLSRVEVAEIQKIPSAAGKEEDSSGHFQNALQMTRTEVPLTPDFRSKYRLHCLSILSSFVRINPQVIFDGFKSRERSEKDYFPSVCEGPPPKNHKDKEVTAHFVWSSWKQRGGLQLADQHALSFRPATAPSRDRQVRGDGADGM